MESKAYAMEEKMDYFLRHCSINTEVNAKFIDLMDENSAVIADLDHPLAEDLLEILAKAAEELNKLDETLNQNLVSTATEIVLGKVQIDKNFIDCFDFRPYQEVLASLLSFREYVTEFEDILQNVKIVDIEAIYEMKMMLQFEFDYLIARYNLFKHEDKLATVFCKLLTDMETVILEESVPLAAISFPRGYEQHQTILRNIGTNVATFKLYESGAIDLDTVVNNWKPNGRILKLMLEHHRIRFRQNLVDILEISPRNKGFVSIDNTNALSPTDIQLRTPEKDQSMEDPLADTPHRGRPVIFTDSDDARRQLFTPETGSSNSLLSALDLQLPASYSRKSKPFDIGIIEDTENQPFQIYEDSHLEETSPETRQPFTNITTPKQKLTFDIHTDDDDDDDTDLQKKTPKTSVPLLKMTSPVHSLIERRSRSRFPQVGDLSPIEEESSLESSGSVSPGQVTLLSSPGSFPGTPPKRMSLTGDLIEFSPGPFPGSPPKIWSPDRPIPEDLFELSPGPFPGTPPKRTSIDQPLHGDLMEFSPEPFPGTPPKKTSSDLPLHEDLIEFSPQRPLHGNLIEFSPGSFPGSPPNRSSPDRHITGDLMGFSSRSQSIRDASLTQSQRELSPVSYQLPRLSTVDISPLVPHGTSSPLSPSTRPKRGFGRILSPSDKPSPIFRQSPPQRYSPSPSRLQSPSQLSNEDHQGSPSFHSAQSDIEEQHAPSPSELGRTISRLFQSSNSSYYSAETEPHQSPSHHPGSPEHSR